MALGSEVIFLGLEVILLTFQTMKTRITAIKENPCNIQIKELHKSISDTRAAQRGLNVPP